MHKKQVEAWEHRKMYEIIKKRNPNELTMLYFNDLRKLDIRFQISIIFVFQRSQKPDSYPATSCIMYSVTKYSLRVMDKYVIIMTHLANITYQKTSNRTLSSIIVVPRHGEPLPRYTSFLQLLCKKPFYPFPHSGNLLSVYTSAFTLI